MKKLTLGVLALSTLVSSYSFANQGFYIGAVVGQAEADISLSDVSDLDDGGNFSNINIDDSDTTYGITAGYRVSTNFAVELGYQDFGEFNVSGNSDGTGSFWFAGPVEATAEATGILLGLKGIYPVQENFEIYGKAGINSWDTDNDLTDSFGAFSASDDGTDPYFGIGASYILNNVSFNASLTRFDISDTDVDVFSIGLEISFAQ